MLYDYTEHGIQIQNDTMLRCLNCGSIFFVSPEEFDCDEYNDCEPMGDRIEYDFQAHCSCPHCEQGIALIQRASEYPLNCIEYVDSPKCSGGEILVSPRVDISFYDEEIYVSEQPHHSRIINSKPQVLDIGHRLPVDIVDGDAYIMDKINLSKRRQTIFLNPARKLLPILVEETGSIRFEENRAVFAEIVQTNPKITAMRLLGKVAEAVLVRNCDDNPQLNRAWLAKARRNRTIQRTADSFRAIGTGLNSTKRRYPHKYNPSDPQRDIVWINEKDEYALTAGGRTTAGMIAGLQVKVSGNGMNYLLNSLTHRRYEVPLVYFPMNDDFERILDRVNKNEVIVEPGFDFIDIRELDANAFYEVQDYYPLLIDLYSGRISGDDFVREAKGIFPLRNGVLATSMSVASSDIRIIR